MVSSSCHSSRSLSSKFTDIKLNIDRTLLTLGLYFFNFIEFNFQHNYNHCKPTFDVGVFQQKDLFVRQFFKPDLIHGK